MAEENNNQEQNGQNGGIDSVADELYKIDSHTKEVEEKLKTHRKINTSLCGKIIKIDEDYAEVELVCTREMAVDDLGLIHGGFTFAAADFAAMAAVNDPNVVLIGGFTKFLAPLEVGDVATFEATARFNDARKRDITVIGKKRDLKIFEAELAAVILNKHILKIKSDNPKMPS